MAFGIVKWFNDSEGFGFIMQTSGEDVFAHYSDIAIEGYKTLRAGENVEFEVARHSRGLRATGIKLVNDEISDQVEDLEVKVKLFDFSNFYLSIKQGEERESIVEIMINRWAARMQRRVINTSMAMTEKTMFVMVTHGPIK